MLLFAQSTNHVYIIISVHVAHHYYLSVFFWRLLGSKLYTQIGTAPLHTMFPTIEAITHIIVHTIAAAYFSKVLDGIAQYLHSIIYASIRCQHFCVSQGLKQ